MEIVRKEGVPTLQLLVQVQIDSDIDDWKLEWKLVPREGRRHPALGWAILRLTTGVNLCLEWSENDQKSGVPTLQLLVPVEIDRYIDGLWLDKS